MACRTEHPLLLELADDPNFRLVGMNYKDERQDALAWLERYGDPYALSIHDPEGRLGLDLGVYGVPETFVIDTHGIIRYKHVGPLTNEDIVNTLRPLLTTLATSP